jgi:hypothetical protein
MSKKHAAQRPKVELDSVLELVDSNMVAWRILERDAGPDASVSVMTVIDELERLRECICLLLKR